MAFDVSAGVLPLVTCLRRDYDQLTDIEITAGQFFQQAQQQGGGLDTHTIRKHRNGVGHHFWHSEVTLSRNERLRKRARTTRQRIRSPPPFRVALVASHAASTASGKTIPNC